MAMLTDHNPDKINARIVFDAARENDPAALEVYNRYIDYLAQAVASIVNLLDPEIIVLGGGVSKAGSFLLDPLVTRFPKYVIFSEQPMPDIRLAVLGPEAGIFSMQNGHRSLHFQAVNTVNSARLGARNMKVIP